MLTIVPPENATPPNFAEKTFANSHITTKFTKIFSLEIEAALNRRTQLTTARYTMLLVQWCHSECSAPSSLLEAAGGYTVRYCLGIESL